MDEFQTEMEKAEEARRQDFADGLRESVILSRQMKVIDEIFNSLDRRFCDK